MTKGRNDGAGWAAARLRPPPLGGGALRIPSTPRRLATRVVVQTSVGAMARLSGPSTRWLDPPTPVAPGAATRAKRGTWKFRPANSSDPPPLARNIVPETPVQPDPYRFTIYNVTMSPLSTSRRSATGRNAFLLVSSSEFRGPTMLHSSARDGLVAGNGLRQ